jgi:16S rRNA processing protein RimM
MSVEHPLNSDRLVTLGRVSGLYGVRGWVKVYSNTEPREGILNYPEWLLKCAHGCRSLAVESGRRQGKSIVAKLAGVDDRDNAAMLQGCEIAVPREQFAATAPGEYYWADLEGLRVVTTQGIELGVVDHLFETGSNDVLVVVDEAGGKRERLIPWHPGEVVKAVDLEGKSMVVDWDPEF